MAVYLNLNSKFKPFSYQELLAPIQAQTAAHNELENQYGELGTLASVWKNRLNKDIDKTAYSLYENYINDLQEQADVLYREGLTPDSTRNLIALRNRYTSDITPIEEAYNQRVAKIKEQNEGQAKDPTRRYSMDASLMSVDDFLNKTVSINSYSGKEIEDNVSKMAANLARDIKDNPYKYQSILNGQYFNMITDPKVTANDILNQLYNEKNPLLQTILNQAVEGVGIQNWNISDSRKLELFADAYEAGSRGLWSAIGETKNHVLANKDFNTNGNSYNNGKKLFYRNIGRVTVDKQNETSKKQEVIDLIRAIQNNPDLATQKSNETKENFFTKMMLGTANQGSTEGPNSFVKNPLTPSYKNNIEYINDLLDEFNLDPIDFETAKPEDIENTIKELESQIAMSIIYHYEPMYDATGPEHLNMSIYASAVNQSKGEKRNTGLYDINSKGKKAKKEVKVDDLKEIFTEGYNTYVLNRGDGLTINHTNEKGKSKRYLVDFGVVGGDSRLQEIFDKIKIYASKGATELMNQEKNDFFKMLYGISENKVKVQSTTTSKQMV